MLTESELKAGISNPDRIRYYILKKFLLNFVLLCFKVSTLPS